MLILVLMATTVNYVDRSNLSIVAAPLTRELRLNPVQLGHLLSAFAWSYALATLAGGFLVDRLGTRLVYGLAQFLWSCATFALAFAGGFASLFGLRLLVGLTESPAFPANNRAVTLWFPQRERGRATGTYIMGQYIGTALFTPLLAWMAVKFGWRSVFLSTGAAGILGALIWMLWYRDPLDCTWMNQPELENISSGGALVHGAARERVKWSEVRQLCLERQIWAICLGKFAIMSSLYFLLTWFPTYLVDERHMTALHAGFATTLPYLAATIGVFLGGSWSDWLMRRGMGVSPARKIPIVSGFLGATTIVFANLTSSNSVALVILTAAFFAQGVSSTSWAIVAEVAPRKLIAFTGGICNFAGNLAGIVTPTVIGHTVQATGSFARVLVFMACAGIVGALSYTVFIGPIHRIELDESERLA
jgi:ACS family D-galactonate transporter-like MFS transporter